jgi:hypothetical protein
MQTARPATHAHKATTTARHGAPNAIAAGITNETAEAKLHILNREIAGTRSGLRTGSRSGTAASASEKDNSRT